MVAMVDGGFGIPVRVKESLAGQMGEAVGPIGVVAGSSTLIGVASTELSGSGLDDPVLDDPVLDDPALDDPVLDDPVLDGAEVKVPALVGVEPDRIELDDVELDDVELDRAAGAAQATRERVRSPAEKNAMRLIIIERVPSSPFPTIGRAYLLRGCTPTDAGSDHRRSCAVQARPLCC